MSMDEEQRLRRQLAELHREYQLRCEPIVKRLVEIEACKPTDPGRIAHLIAGWRAERAEEWIK